MNIEEQKWIDAYIDAQNLVLTKLKKMYPTYTTYGNGTSKNGDYVFLRFNQGELRWNLVFQYKDKDSYFIVTPEKGDMLIVNESFPIYILEK